MLVQHSNRCVLDKKILVFAKTGSQVEDRLVLDRDATRQFAPQAGPGTGLLAACRRALGEDLEDAVLGELHD
eukprot:10378844-Heterocapsa_arctica.AAC.1